MSTDELYNKQFTQQVVGIIRKELQKHNGFDIEEIKIIRREDFRSKSDAPRFDIQIKYSNKLEDYPWINQLDGSKHCGQG